MVKAQTLVAGAATRSVAIFFGLVLVASVVACSAIPGLEQPTTTPTPTNTPTATATSTPTPTPTATATPTLAPLALSVRLEPDVVQQGHIATLVIQANRPATVTASLLSKPLSLFEEGGRWYGLIGVWAGTQPDSWPLTVTGQNPVDGSLVVEQCKLQINPRHFEIESVTLTQSTLDLILDREAVQKEAQLLASLIAPYTPKRLWQGPFQQPIQGEVSSTYGLRRSYNGGPPGEYHGGLDLAADEGLPVAAANAGRVVFAGPLKVRGNVVVIDHGWGLYSGYYHLGALKTAAGQDVRQGETIGLVGSTGLSTGPHLHWSVWVGGNAVDPALLLEWQLPDG